MSAKTIATRAAQIATATTPWDRLEPSRATVMDVQTSVDFLQRDLQRLIEVDPLDAFTGMSAGQLACDIANASRALQSLSLGFRSHLPDKYALAAADRLSLKLRRSLYALNALSKDVHADE